MMSIPEAARELRAAGYTTRHTAGGHATAYRWTGRNNLRVTINRDGIGLIVRAVTTGNQRRVIECDVTQTLQGIAAVAVSWAQNVDVVHKHFGYVASANCPTFDPSVLLFEALGTLDVAA